MKATLANGLSLNHDISKDFENDFLKEIYKAVPIEITMDYKLGLSISKENRYKLWNEYIINFMDLKKEMYLNRMDPDSEYSLFRSLSTLPDEERENMKKQLDEELGFLCEKYVEAETEAILKSIANTTFENGVVEMTSISSFLMDFVGKQKDNILFSLTNFLKSHVKEVEKIYYKVFIDNEEGENEE